MPEELNRKSTAGNSEELRDEQLEDMSGGVIESLGVKYTMFNPDGTPVRSKSNSDDSKVGLVDNSKRST